MAATKTSGSTHMTTRPRTPTVTVRSTPSKSATTPIRPATVTWISRSTSWSTTTRLVTWLIGTHSSTPSTMVHGIRSARPGQHTTTERMTSKSTCTMRKTTTKTTSPSRASSFQRVTREASIRKAVAAVTKTSGSIAGITRPRTPTRTTRMTPSKSATSLTPPVIAT